MPFFSIMAQPRLAFTPAGIYGIHVAELARLPGGLRYVPTRLRPGRCHTLGGD